MISLLWGCEGSEPSYPVVYLLYGDQVKGYFAEAVHILDWLGEPSEIPQMILVGIVNTERYRDNLPLYRDGSPGGADKFLKFFMDELIPFNESAAYTIEKVLNKSGINGALKKYHEIKSDTETNLYFDEWEFNALGYRLMPGEILKRRLRFLS